MTCSMPAPSTSRSAPRWYSTYEMASNAITALIEGAHISAIPYSARPSASARS